MKKIIIIGAGVSGLTAGIYGQRLGMECTVIDKNPEAGGALCGWERNGFTVDGCLHWLTGTLPGTELYDLWHDVGMLSDGDIVKTDAFYTSTLGGESVSMYSDAERTKDEMMRLSPEDSDEIRRFFNAVRAAKCISGLPYGGNPMSRAASFSHLAPYAKTDLNTLSERFHHPLLSHVITDYIGGRYSSLGLIMAYATYSSGNGYLPRGGSRAAAERMAKRFTDYGGKLLLSRTVRRIITNSARVGVELDNDELIFGDKVLVCCDPSALFGAMSDYADVPSRLIRQYTDETKYPAFSSLNSAFSVDAERLPFKGTTAFSCRALSENPMNPARLLVREFSHEPTFSPSGKSIIQCLFFNDGKDATEWINLRDERKEAYNEKKRLAAQNIISRIEEEYPSLKGKINPLDVWTPATFKRYLNSYKGSYMSFAVMPSVIPAHFSGRLRDMPDVIVASQWRKSPGGVPIAAEIGKSTIEAVAFS